MNVFAGPWMKALSQHRKLYSRHGHLAADPTSAARHAVVITQWQARHPAPVTIHDPWYDMLAQPLRAEVAWLRSSWTGEVACYLP